MPSYRLLEIQTSATMAAAKVEKAKADGAYEGNEAALDREVVALIKPMADKAAEWSKENAVLADAKRRAAQTAVKNMEALIKAKGFSEKHLQSMAAQAQIVLQSLVDIKADNSALNDALVPQYRKDGWITISRDAMQDPSPINDMQKARLNQIKVSAGTVQLTKRMEEYEKRIKAYLKAGERKLGDMGTLNDAVQEVDEIVAKMERDRTIVSDTLYQCSNALTNVERHKKDKTAVPPREMDMIRGYSAKFKADGKQARGKLKTMNISINMLSKRLKGVQGLASMAKPQIKEATALIQSAKKEYDTFATRVKNAEKIIAKLEKLA